jgi:uncharacterized protein (TIGR02145 family)
VDLKNMITKTKINYQNIKPFATSRHKMAVVSSLTTGAWCYYNNDPTSNGVYGKLHNWYAAAGVYDATSAANPSLRKKLAPTGWHVPTDPEWTQLQEYLGGELVAGGKMKTTGTIQARTGVWQDPNTAATDESGFIGLPGGCRCEGGSFGTIGEHAVWWSSSESTTMNAWFRNLNYDDGDANRANGDKILGFSVRCLRDENP